MMLISAILPLVGAAVAAQPSSDSPLTLTSQAPIRLWVSNDRRFREGETVRVQVDAEVDGYLLVVHYDPFGRLRVLFPLDPRDDGRVRAGRRYEVRDDEGRGAFRANGDGSGLIISAIAAEPWRFEEIVLEGRWDYDRFTVSRDLEDSEEGITEQIQRLSGPGGFDYDALGYRVYGENYTTSTVVYEDYGAGPIYGSGAVYLYDDYYYCNDWFWRGSGRCRYYDRGWSYGFGIGFGYPYRYHRGFYYDPFYYDSFSYPYNHWNYGYGYNPYYPGTFVPRYPRAVLTGRPRNYTVHTINPNRTFGGGGLPSRAGGDRRTPGRVLQPTVDWRTREATRGVGARGFLPRQPDATRGTDRRDGRPVREVGRREGGAGVGREDIVTRAPSRRGGPVVDRDPGRREGTIITRDRGPRDGPIMARGPARREGVNPPDPRPARPESVRSRPPEGRGRNGVAPPDPRSARPESVRSRPPEGRGRNGEAPRAAPSSDRNRGGGVVSRGSGGGGNRGGGQVSGGNRSGGGGGGGGGAAPSRSRRP